MCLITQVGARVLKRHDRTLPLELRPAFLQPEIPEDNYAYLEMELVEAGGLAVMFGVSRECGVYADSQSIAGELWAFSAMDGSAWHDDEELPLAPPQGLMSALLWRLATPLGCLLNCLPIPLRHDMRARGYRQRGGGSEGDCFGLLIHRQRGTMQVLVK